MKNNEKKKNGKEIIACPNCASRDLDWIGRWGPESALVFLGSPMMGVYRCIRCGYEGLPLEFKDEEEYQKFVKYKEDVKAGRIKEEELEKPEGPAAELPQTEEKRPPLAARMMFANLKVQVIVMIVIVLILFILSILVSRLS